MEKAEMFYLTETAGGNHMLALREGTVGFVSVSAAVPGCE